MPDIFETGCGWITPKGEFLGCNFYDHIAIVISHVQNPQALELVEGLHEIEQGSLRLIEEGEHPEWHVYEMAKDDADDAIVRMAYEEGFVRVGVGRDIGVIGAEGTPAAIKARMVQIRKVVKEYNAGHGVQYKLRANPREHSRGRYFRPWED